MASLRDDRFHRFAHGRDGDAGCLVAITVLAFTIAFVLNLIWLSR